MTVCMFATLTVKADKTVKANTTKEAKGAVMDTSKRPEVNKKMPQVLIIGDSISLGYTLEVRKLLKGKADVYRPSNINCQHTGYGLAHLKEWLGDKKWDVIHFNWGIWDAHLVNKYGGIVSTKKMAKINKTYKDFRVRHTPEQYRENLEKLIDMMRKSSDKLIWASTTPVYAPKMGYLERIKILNDTAAGVMEYQEIPINDLYAYSFPHTKEWLKADQVHFNELGRKMLARKVAQSILKELGREESPVGIKPRRIPAKKEDAPGVIRYEHKMLSQWGFSKKEQENYFLVVEPRKPNKLSRPLMICLHSAGGNGLSESPRNIQRVHKAGDEFFGLLLNCPKTEWWWGANKIKKNPEKYKKALTATENCLLETIEWVIQKYNIDRTRVYLRGISMGGSGSLGLAMVKGELFAAVYVQIPAFTAHSRFRLPMSPGNIPYIVSMFSHMDKYSEDMETFFDVAKKEKLGLTSAWGPRGHNWKIHEKEMPPEVYEFPWLSLRNNQAYPVFLNCSADDKFPGFKGKGKEQIGQINGYFRWCVSADQEDAFRIQLRLVNDFELTRKPLKPIPETVTTDIALRRVQNFTLIPGKRCAWLFEEDGKLLSSGTVTVDSKGLVTIKKLELTHKPRYLILK